MTDIEIAQKNSMKPVQEIASSGSFRPGTGKIVFTIAPDGRQFTLNGEAEGHFCPSACAVFR